MPPRVQPKRKAAAKAAAKATVARWRLIAVELLGRKSRRQLRSRRQDSAFRPCEGLCSAAEEPETEEEEDEGEDEDEPEEPPAKKVQPACSSCSSHLD